MRLAFVVLAALLFGLCAAPQAPAQARCGMELAATHIDPDRTTIWASTSGEKALFFSADIDVNIDGAARSYHPDDPRGQTLALNNIANAITRIFDAEGRDITCSSRRGACFTRFIETFEQSRDAGYDPVGHPRFETTHIIPWRHDPALGREAPCTIMSGPHAGYFVSQTAMLADASANICDQHRYLDNLSFNAIVLPKHVDWRAQGTPTDGGDLVVVRDDASGRIAFALIGDRGPTDSIGEGSVALAATLAGKAVPPDATFANMKALKRVRVQYLIFPARDVPRLTAHRLTQADIDRLGTEVFADFGGPERLAACIRLPLD